MIRYKTAKFDIADDDILWEKFMCFARTIIPYETYWDQLPEGQKYPLISFIYESEVIGEGHMGFIDLHSDYISFNDVIKSLKVLQVSSSYIENIENISEKYLSVDELVDQSEDEEYFETRMEELDAIFEAHDKLLYDLVNESSEIEDKILCYVRENIDEFFEWVE